MQALRQPRIVFPDFPFEPVADGIIHRIACCAGDLAEEDLPKNGVSGEICKFLCEGFAENRVEHLN